MEENNVNGMMNNISSNDTAILDSILKEYESQKQNKFESKYSEIYVIWDNCNGQIKKSLSEINKCLSRFCEEFNDNLFIIENNTESRYEYKSIEIHNKKLIVLYCTWHDKKLKKIVINTNHIYTTFDDFDINFFISPLQYNFFIDYEHVYNALKLYLDKNSLKTEDFLQEIILSKLTECRTAFNNAVIDINKIFAEKGENIAFHVYSTAKDINEEYNKVEQYLNVLTLNEYSEAIEKSKLYNDMKSLDRKSVMQYLIYATKDKKYNQKLKEALFKGVAVDDIYKHNRYEDFYKFVHNTVKETVTVKELISMWKNIKETKEL